MSGLLPLLKLIVDSGAVSPKAPTEVRRVGVAVRQTEGSLSNLAAGLFGVGPITEIKQSFEITEFGLEDATSAFLEAGIGLPKEKKGTGGRF
jgi:hypothetical protein